MVHLGISILAMMLESAQMQVAWDKELKDNAAATVLTVADVKASKKGPPETPQAYNSGMRVLH